MDTLDRIEKGSLAKDVMQKLIAYINQGMFPAGSKLPSNDELARMFGVGRSSVREALKELQTLGIVTLKHGEGTYVCNFSSIEEGPMKFVAEVRRMIEVHSAEEAVKKATQEDLNTLKEWYHLMEKHFDDDPLFIYYDRQFHYKIAEISRNPMITSILKSIEILFAQLQYSVILLEGQKARALDEHRQILEAFMLRDRDQTIGGIHLHHDHILEGWIKVYKNKRI